MHCCATCRLQVAPLKESGLAPMELAAALSHLSSHSGRLSREASLHATAAPAAVHCGSHGTSAARRPATAAPVPRAASLASPPLARHGSGPPRPGSAPARPTRRLPSGSPLSSGGPLPPPVAGSAGGTPGTAAVAEMQHASGSVLRHASELQQESGLVPPIPAKMHESHAVLPAADACSLQPVPELSMLDLLPGVALCDLPRVGNGQWHASAVRCCGAHQHAFTFECCGLDVRGRTSCVSSAGVQLYRVWALVQASRMPILFQGRQLATISTAKIEQD